MRLDASREPWMTAPETRVVLDALTKDGSGARFVGGVVRNALLHRPVSDIDIATPLVPEELSTVRLPRLQMASRTKSPPCAAM
jgi:tRNA nucleotidyltransferase/poly(A) polymerase